MVSFPIHIYLVLVAVWHGVWVSSIALGVLCIGVLRRFKSPVFTEFSYHVPY